MKSAQMTNMQDFLEISASRHKHLCPRQVLGVRIGMLATKHLEFDLPQANKRLLTIIETDGCFADGIEVTTGCTVGHRTLRIMDFGKVAAVFGDTKTGKTFRIAPKLDVRTVAGEYASKGENRWERQLLAYQSLPDEILLELSPVHLIPSLEIIQSRPGIRTNCLDCGEEIINEREIITETGVLCRTCAGYGYYESLELFSDENSGDMFQHLNKINSRLLTKAHES